MKRHANRNSGFTLLEMMVAMAVFMVVAGAAVSLYRRHVPLATMQQNQTATNISLRNAAAQLQTDLGNAGSGFYQGANIPALPVGITVTPGTGTCHSAGTTTYGSGCFDTLDVISVDSSAPPAHPLLNGNINGAGCSNAQDISQSSILSLTPVGSGTMAQLAAAYNAGDEALVISEDGTEMSTITLTKAGAVNGNKVDLQHHPISGPPTGQNYNSQAPNGGINTSELYGITNPTNNNKLNSNFCSSAWVLKISAVSYGVDASNPADPVLTRSVDNGQPATVADQIIGFRIGALAQSQNDPASFPSPQPNTQDCPLQWWYDTSCYDLTTIQAVEVSLIGRTNPANGRVAGFTNTFDNGNYKVESISVVVDPRNLSMNN